MKKIFPILASLFLLLLSNPILAQEDPGADPDVAAPIDGYVYVLAFLGLVYVFLRLRAFAKANTPQQ
jgi:phosphoglycerol transferase MdoB-like AlkP superfamily enzyme